MAEQGYILGFHGCEWALALDVLMGRRDLEHSNNRYDWLGRGIYFWEHNPLRALQWALFQERRGKIEKPFVLGAILTYGNCLDLTEADGIEAVQDAHEKLLNLQTLTGLEMPKNKSAGSLDEDLVLRYLDCAVINTIHSSEEGAPYDTVRGMFTEGAAAYDGAGFREKTHTQIAVVNPHVIKGFFLPRDPQFIRLLSEL